MVHNSPDDNRPRMRARLFEGDRRRTSARVYADEVVYSKQKYNGAQILLLLGRSGGMGAGADERWAHRGGEGPVRLQI